MPKPARIQFQETITVGAVRAKMNLDIRSFAHIMGVSIRTIESWEQGRRQPSGSATRLLIFMWKEPGLAKQLLLS